MKSKPAQPDLAVPLITNPVLVHTVPFRNSAEKRTGILQEVLSNPYRLCTAEEIALCIGRQLRFVYAAKAWGCPFPGGVSRPEWVLNWLQATPRFDVKGEPEICASK